MISNQTMKFQILFSFPFSKTDWIVMCIVHAWIVMCMCPTIKTKKFHFYSYDIMKCHFWRMWMKCLMECLWNIIYLKNFFYILNISLVFWFLELVKDWHWMIIKLNASMPALIKLERESIFIFFFFSKFFHYCNNIFFETFSF